MNELKKCPFCGLSNERKQLCRKDDLILCSNPICPSVKFGTMDNERYKQVRNRRANSE